MLVVDGARDRRLVGRAQGIAGDHAIHSRAPRRVAAECTSSIASDSHSPTRPRAASPPCSPPSSSVDGSTYRGTGARMVVRADGIHGRRGERRLSRGGHRRARGGAVRERAAPTSRTTTRAAPDDDVLGLGMGCQGVIDVRLEPLAGDALQRGDRELAELRARDAVRLLVCGGGADAIPRRAHRRAHGWLVTVVDHRPSFATTERFPDAERVLLIESRDPAHSPASLALDRSPPRW